jgi:uncharacterized protein with HEPN domain
MPRDPLCYLFDVSEAASIIFQLTQGRTYDDYLADIQFRSAVERHLITIGESISQLALRHPLIAQRIPEYQKIVSFRNVLIHGYREVRNLTVWGVVETDLPALLEVIDRLRQELEH